MKVLILRHIPHEHLGTVVNTLEAKGLDYEYINFYENEKPVVSIEDYRGLIILGGPMNVYETDKYPFLETEDKLIKRATKRNIPILGICLGAQSIAKALGARVTKNKEKEIGWYSLKTTEEAKKDKMFRHFNTNEVVFQWHGDTFDIPNGAVHLAESPLCRNQAFRYGSNVYGLQFHIEVTPQMISEWLSVPENQNEIKSLEKKDDSENIIDPDTINVKTPGFIERLNALAENVFGEFCDLIK